MKQIAIVLSFSDEISLIDQTYIKLMFAVWMMENCYSFRLYVIVISSNVTSANFEVYCL